MKDHVPTAIRSVCLHSPNDGVAGSIGRDARCRAWPAKSRGALRSCRRHQSCAGELESLELVTSAHVINRIIEVSWRIEGIRNCVNRLDGIGVTGGVVMAHIVAVDQIDFTFFAATKDQMGMAGATRGIRQHHCRSRA